MGNILKSFDDEQNQVFSNLQWNATLIGPIDSGKTSIVYQIKNKTFLDPPQKSSSDTVSDFTKITLAPLKNNIERNIILWDVLLPDASKLPSSFGSYADDGYTEFVRRGFYRNADIVIIVVSTENPFNSYKNELEQYLVEINEHGLKLPRLFMLINKIDLGVSTNLNETKEWAQMNNIPFFLVSAKTGENVENAFNQIGTQMNKYISL